MKLSHLRNVCLALLSLSLFSCGAKRAPERITVIAPENFTGRINLAACHPKAPANNIVLDSSGNGKTSVCSASPDLKLVIIRGQQSVEIPAKTSKTGDSFVVMIAGEVR